MGKEMKLHHQEVTVKVLVPEGYHIADVLTDQAVIPRLAECHEVDYNTIADIITARITIKKD
jgi:hypothetical protein